MKIIQTTKSSEIQEIVATTTSIEDARLALNKIQLILTEENNQIHIKSEICILKTIIDNCRDQNVNFFFLYMLQNQDNYNTICHLINIYNITITEEVYNTIKNYTKISNIHILSLLRAPSEIIDYKFIFDHLNTEKFTSDILVQLIRANQYDQTIMEKFLTSNVLYENVENSIFIIKSLINKFENYDMLLELITSSNNSRYTVCIKDILESMPVIQERHYNKIIKYIRNLKSVPDQNDLKYLLNRLSTTKYIFKDIAFYLKIYSSYKIDLYDSIVTINSNEILKKNISILNLFDRFMKNEFSNFKLGNTNSFIKFADIYGLDSINIEVKNEKHEFIFFNFIATYYINHKTTEDDLKYILNLVENNINKTTLSISGIISTIRNKLYLPPLNETNFLQPDNLIYDEKTFNMWKQIVATQNMETLKLKIELEIIALYNNLRTHELWFEFTLRQVFKLCKIIELCNHETIYFFDILNSLDKKIAFIKEVYSTYYTTKKMSCSTIDLIGVFSFQFQTKPFIPNQLNLNDQVEFLIKNHLHYTNDIIFPILKKQLDQNIDLFIIHIGYILNLRNYNLNEISEYLTYFFNLQNSTPLEIFSRINSNNYDFSSLLKMFKLQIKSLELKNESVFEKIKSIVEFDFITNYHLIYNNKMLFSILKSQLNKNSENFQVHTQSILPHRNISFNEIVDYLTYYFNLPNIQPTLDQLSILTKINSNDYDFTDLVNLFKLQISKTNSAALKEKLIFEQINLFFQLNKIKLSTNYDLKSFYSYIISIISKEDVLKYLKSLDIKLLSIYHLNLICIIHNEQFNQQIIDEETFIISNYNLYDNSMLLKILKSQLNKNSDNFKIHTQSILPQRNISFSEIADYLTYYFNLQNIKVTIEQLQILYSIKYEISNFTNLLNLFKLQISKSTSELKKQLIFEQIKLFFTLNHTILYKYVDIKSFSSYITNIISKEDFLNYLKELKFVSSIDGVYLITYTICHIQNKEFSPELLLNWNFITSNHLLYSNKALLIILKNHLLINLTSFNLHALWKSRDINLNEVNELLTHYFNYYKIHNSTSPIYLNLSYVNNNDYDFNDLLNLFKLEVSQDICSERSKKTTQISQLFKLNETVVSKNLNLNAFAKYLMTNHHKYTDKNMQDEIIQYIICNIPVSTYKINLLFEIYCIQGKNNFILEGINDIDFIKKNHFFLNDTTLLSLLKNQLYQDPKIFEIHKTYIFIFHKLHFDKRSEYLTYYFNLPNVIPNIDNFKILSPIYMELYYNYYNNPYCYYFSKLLDLFKLQTSKTNLPQLKKELIFEQIKLFFKFSKRYIYDYNPELFYQYIVTIISDKEFIEYVEKEDINFTDNLDLRLIGMAECKIKNKTFIEEKDIPFIQSNHSIYSNKILLKILKYNLSQNISEFKIHITSILPFRNISFNEINEYLTYYFNLSNRQPTIDQLEILKNSKFNNFNFIDLLNLFKLQIAKCTTKEKFILDQIKFFFELNQTMLSKNLNLKLFYKYITSIISKEEFYKYIASNIEKTELNKNIVVLHKDKSETTHDSKFTTLISLVKDEFETCSKELKSDIEEIY